MTILNDPIQGAGGSKPAVVTKPVFGNPRFPRIVPNAQSLPCHHSPLLQHGDEKGIHLLLVNSTQGSAMLFMTHSFYCVCSFLNHITWMRMLSVVVKENQVLSNLELYWFTEVGTQRHIHLMWQFQNVIKGPFVCVPSTRHFHSLHSVIASPDGTG